MEESVAGFLFPEIPFSAALDLASVPCALFIDCLEMPGTSSANLAP
jgi:hypothetical protein